MNQPFATNPQQRAETCAVNGCSNPPATWAAVQGHFEGVAVSLTINCWLCESHYQELSQ